MADTEITDAQIERFERGVTCLALELPAAVYDDFAPMARALVAALRSERTQRTRREEFHEDRHRIVREMYEASQAELERERTQNQKLRALLSTAKDALDPVDDAAFIERLQATLFTQEA